MELKTLDDFKKSIHGSLPLDELSVHGKALWWVGKGNWDKAHELIQDINDKPASLIHAYLHRFEGDLSNAHYWYAKAGVRVTDQSLEQEWESLVKDLVIGS